MGTQNFNAASVDNTSEATIIAAEPVTDPAAPASGAGAGDIDGGAVSWAETATDNRAMTKTKALNAVTDAMAKWTERKSACACVSLRS